jgi:hypothetical protein
MVLRFCGLSGDKTFCKYHRFLSRARWDSLKAARILLTLLTEAFCAPGQPLIFGIDETIERRRGARIKAKGIYRDPVRSSNAHFVKCSGLRWMCLMLLTRIPWTDKVWALPFLTALAPSQRYYKEYKKGRHKKITDWARQMILTLCRWLAGRKIIITADSSYSALELLAALRKKATLVTRLRMDAALYNPVMNKEKQNPGRPRLKDKRQPTLKDRLSDPALTWVPVTIPQWYGQKDKKMELASGTAVWYHSGMEPVTIRWVLLRDPQGRGEPAALLSTDETMEGTEIVDAFIRRWTVAVTLKEVRTHMGIETQRQWSDKAIARATPCLMGLFSITVLWADELNKAGSLRVERTAWYHKRLPTFSDALAAVRSQLWGCHSFYTSGTKGQTTEISLSWLNFLTDRLARAA